jgi:hypothetical protein
MEAAVVVTELGARAAKFITITEPDPITVAADADADPEFFSAGYGRCRNGNSRQGCKRKTKFSHVPSSLVAAQEKNGGTERLFLERSGFINPHVAHHQLLATTYIPPFKMISRPSSSRRTGYSLSSRAGR